MAEKKRTNTKRTEKYNALLDDGDVDKMLCDAIENLTGKRPAKIRAQIATPLNVYYDLEIANKTVAS